MTLLQHQKVRQVGTERGLSSEGEVRALAAELDFDDAGCVSVLVAVTCIWPTVRGADQDKAPFRAPLRAVYGSDDSSPLAKALSAEAMSSTYGGTDDAAEFCLDWSGRAVDLAGQLDEVSEQLLIDKVTFGLWDRGLREFEDEEARTALRRFVFHGAFDAPGRVFWWSKRLQQMVVDGAITTSDEETELYAWFMALSGRRQFEHCMRLDYLKGHMEKLAARFAS